MKLSVKGKDPITGVSFATAYATGYAALLIQNFREEAQEYSYEVIKKPKAISRNRNVIFINVTSEAKSMYRPGSDAVRWAVRQMSGL
ncbi:hypothetical protein [Paenibacillus humicus]|uniref:hypothetical protein n=1 Tax=Paenibacillus humicus TaxID=412861 RepID=UPI003D293764